MCVYTYTHTHTHICIYIYININFQIELKEKYHQRKPRASINEEYLNRPEKQEYAEQRLEIIERHQGVFK